jgi:hypothetical protein
MLQIKCPPIFSEYNLSLVESAVSPVLLVVVCPYMRLRLRPSNAPDATLLRFHVVCAKIFASNFSSTSEYFHFRQKLHFSWNTFGSGLSKQNRAVLTTKRVTRMPAKLVKLVAIYQHDLPVYPGRRTLPGICFYRWHIKDALTCPESLWHQYTTRFALVTGPSRKVLASKIGSSTAS